MGAYYARHDGESDEVAAAIEDHYKPRFSGDALPRNMTGIVVALADKMETLAGMFGIGQLPTGDKDPFALRRHALGVIRMLVDGALPLSLVNMVNEAYAAFPPGMLAQTQTELRVFFIERFDGLLRERGHSPAEVDAVLSQNPIELSPVPRQLEAVRSFAAMPEAPALASANKRVANILKKAGGEPVHFDAGHLKEDAERALHAALVAVAPRAEEAFRRGDYTASLQALAALKAPVDAFFDKVMVNSDDPALRANRLALLSQLHTAMNRVADLSKLAS
jgi:glycyl-tRNA synthetase beta chain